MPDTRVTADLLAELGSQLLLDVLTYWGSKRRGRAMPSRSDIDPAEIVPLLTHIGIIEVRGPRLLCVLLGTGINDAFGSDHTGKYIDETLTGERLAFFEAFYRRAIDERRPLHLENLYQTPDGRTVRVQRLLLPLSNDGATVNKLILAMDFGEELRRGSVSCDVGPVAVTRTAATVDLPD